MKTPVSFFCALLVAGMFAAPARAADPEFFYYYNGAKKALELDEGCVAVKLRVAKPGAMPSEAEAKGLAARALALGYEAEDAKSLRPGGWVTIATKSAATKLNLPAQASRKEKHRRLLDDLTKLDGVEFAGPVFKDAKGHPVNFEPTLLVGFLPGTPEAEQERILKTIPHVKTQERHGQANKWLLELTARNGLDVLDAANAIAALPSVRYADPNYLLIAEQR